jgi:hypothetical protein
VLTIQRSRLFALEVPSMLVDHTPLAIMRRLMLRRVAPATQGK